MKLIIVILPLLVMWQCRRCAPTILQIDIFLKLCIEKYLLFVLLCNACLIKLKRRNKKCFPFSISKFSLVFIQLFSYLLGKLNNKKLGILDMETVEGRKTIAGKRESFTILKIFSWQTYQRSEFIKLSELGSLQFGPGVTQSVPSPFEMRRPCTKLKLREKIRNITGFDDHQLTSCLPFWCG